MDHKEKTPIKESLFTKIQQSLFADSDSKYKSPFSQIKVIKQTDPNKHSASTEDVWPSAYSFDLSWKLSLHSTNTKDMKLTWIVYNSPHDEKILAKAPDEVLETLEKF